MKAARKARGLTQVDLARKLGLSQGYVSLVERGRRSLPANLAARVAGLLNMSPTLVPAKATGPLRSDEARRLLGTLGYQGFRYLETNRRLNPAEVLLRTLRADALDARVVRALPWLLVNYPDLNWAWLVKHAKQEDRQNRLGFVVSLARRLAELEARTHAAATLSKWEQALESSRLLKTDRLSSVTQAEERWLRQHSSDEAKHWNVLSSLTPASLRSAG